MRNILHNVVICLFFFFLVNIVEAGIRWTPPREYLPPEKLEPLLQEWNRAMSSSDFLVRDRQLQSIVGMIPDGERFSGAFYCLFDNPEIIDRVVNLYLAEVARVQAGKRTPPRGPYGHGDAEYLKAVAEIAESTFDPRIHEEILLRKIHTNGAFREVYIAAVNPERTLDRFFDELFQRKTGSWYQVFATLSNMTVESPEALRNNRERAIAFVAKYARHYANPLVYVRKGHMKYYSKQDYYTRSDALDVLELVGAVTEVPLVEEIIHDAKEVNLNKVWGAWGRQLDTYLDHGYEQIQDKGQRIIEILRQRSPSWR